MTFIFECKKDKLKIIHPFLLTEGNQAENTENKCPLRAEDSSLVWSKLSSSYGHRTKLTLYNMLSNFLNYGNYDSNP